LPRRDPAVWERWPRSVMASWVMAWSICSGARACRWWSCETQHGGQRWCGTGPHHQRGGLVSCMALELQAWGPSHWASYCRTRGEGPRVGCLAWRGLLGRACLGMAMGRWWSCVGCSVHARPSWACSLRHLHARGPALGTRPGDAPTNSTPTTNHHTPRGELAGWRCTVWGHGTLGMGCAILAWRPRWPRSVGTSGGGVEGLHRECVSPAVALSGEVFLGSAVLVASWAISPRKQHTRKPTSRRPSADLP